MYYNSSLAVKAELDLGSFSRAKLRLTFPFTLPWSHETRDCVF